MQQGEHACLGGLVRRREAVILEKPFHPDDWLVNEEAF
jgi:hypothetical protein